MLSHIHKFRNYVYIPVNVKKVKDLVVVFFG